MTLNDFVTSLIRTYVPFIVGGFISWLTTKGINLDPQAAFNLGAFLTFLLGGVYYAVARVLESKFPQLGWLLGSAKKPEYTEPK